MTATTFTSPNPPPQGLECRPRSSWRALSPSTRSPNEDIHMPEQCERPSARLLLPTYLTTARASGALPGPSSMVGAQATCFPGAVDRCRPARHLCRCGSNILGRELMTFVSLVRAYCWMVSPRDEGGPGGHLARCTHWYHQHNIIRE